MTYDMDKTPVRRNFKRNQITEDCSNLEFRQGKCSTSTPVKNNTCDSDDSFSYTQETNDDIDVVWDWNSPQIKIKPKRDKRRFQESFKSVIPHKKPMLSNKLEFEKLKQELQALKDEIAQNDEECIPLSPLEERHFKDIGNNIHNVSVSHLNDDFEINHPFDDIEFNRTQVDKKEIEKLLNDSEDEQLLILTQMIEDKLEKTIPIPVDFKKKHIVNLHDKFNFGKDSSFNKLADDSFDMVLKKFEDEDIKNLTQACEKKTFISKSVLGTNFKRTFSDVDHSVSGNIEKLNFSRTLSFETAIKPKEDVTKAVLKEIERKKNEALAKRKAKSKLNCDNLSSISPIKCSPEEIEQKRKQALAKLQAKKQIDLAEKNRLEALKRLEANKLKKIGGNKKT